MLPSPWFVTNCSFTPSIVTRSYKGNYTANEIWLLHEEQISIAESYIFPVTPTSGDTDESIGAWHRCWKSKHALTHNFWCYQNSTGGTRTAWQQFRNARKNSRRGSPHPGTGTAPGKTCFKARIPLKLLDVQKHPTGCPLELVGTRFRVTLGLFLWYFSIFLWWLKDFLEILWQCSTDILSRFVCCLGAAHLIIQTLTCIER